MKKHRIDNIRKVSGASEPEITPEHHKKNVERVVDMIMDVVDRLPANPAPVLESYQDLLNEMRHGVKRQPTIIQTSESDTGIISGDEKKPIQLPISLTKNDVGGEENSGKNKFTDFEMELLRKIQNGES
jgi:hypothetical protein